MSSTIVVRPNDNDDQEPVEVIPVTHQYSYDEGPVEIRPSYDEEPVDETREVSPGSEVEVIHGGKLDMRITKPKVVWQGEADLKFSVELTRSAVQGDDNERLGVDIVIIVDVSSSMSSSKSEEYLKTAMAFFIRKLGPTDRLCVVKFSTTAERLCPLRLMTEDAQASIAKLIECLEVGVEECGNLAAGLGLAVQVVKDRSYSEGRKPALVILSRSEATHDAAQVPIGDIPVHVFAIGGDFAHDVLKQIATKSIGGTFSILDFEEPEWKSDLSHMFSECLGKLLTVLVQDLKLTVTPLKDTSISEIKPIIKKVDAEYHTQTESDGTGSITVSFGRLYRRQRCQVSVTLLLPTVDHEMDAEVLQLTYSYYDGVESYDAGPIVVTVTRSRPPAMDTCAIPIMHNANTGSAIQAFFVKKDKFKSVHTNTLMDKLLGGVPKFRGQA